MIKIDSHQHFWRYRPEDYPWITPDLRVLQRDRLTADAQAGWTEAGVSGCVAVQARTSEAENADLLAMATQDPRIRAVVGWVDLTAPTAADRLAHWAEHSRFRGVRHVLQDEPDVDAWVEQVQVNRALAAVQRLGLVYDVLVYSHQLGRAVLDFCARHGNHWLVLDHAAKPPLAATLEGDAEPLRLWRSHIRELARLPHVMCKLSGLVTELGGVSPQGITAVQRNLIYQIMDHVLDCFGPERILYGSDWPVCEVAVPMAQVHTLARQWAGSRLNESQQQAFWADNAQRCYQWTD